MVDWNPDLYLRFKNERGQPARDLVARIGGDTPSRILDVGCGPGNSTTLLSERWPKAKLIGLDSSAAMIEKARADRPDLHWLHRDAAGDLSDLGLFDLVFSNAALQWIRDHERLLPRLFGLLETDGLLAVQVPNNGESPLPQAVRGALRTARWRGVFPMELERFFKPPDYYYRLLSPLSPDVCLWETTYYHILDSIADIMEWHRGTFLRQYLDQLQDIQTKRDFEKFHLLIC